MKCSTFLFAFCFAVLNFNTSCKKNDISNPRLIDGVITLNVHVQHHSWGVSYIDVYLAKNKVEWPGMDTSVYNWHARTNQDGNCSFQKLFPGNYYLFATGYDPIFRDSVIGYIPVFIDESTIEGNMVDVTMIVSE
jgi:hypothetical protein